AGRRHAAALRIARQQNDTEEERFQLRNLAYVAETEGHLNWAMNYNRQALYLALLAEDEDSISQIAYDLARLLVKEDAWVAQALPLLEKSAALHPRGEVLTLLEKTRARYDKLQRTGFAFPYVES